MQNIIKIVSDRDCNGCTKCCEGWLAGTAHGHDFHKGKRCFWMSKSGCNIYDFRPIDPCVNYKCLWKTEKIVPLEFKPSSVGVIITPRLEDGFHYISIIYAGNEIPNIMRVWIKKMLDEGKVENFLYIGDKHSEIFSNNIEFTSHMKYKINGTGIDKETGIEYS